MSLTPNLEAILKSIVVRSENDPANPEFPPDNPRFPATQMRRIIVPGFSDVSIKDESMNSTHTHKDRMAWEIIVTYKQILEAMQRGEIKELPRMSIISTGNAALAIQTMLKQYKLPDLAVLMDSSTDQRVIEYLRGIGCKVYVTDLSQKILYSRDILRTTDNPKGRDITSGRGFEPIGRYYDWFSYEVLNISPDYVICPYGTGDLFGNILTISVREVSAREHDPRFQGRVSVLRNCNFIGAKTKKPNTRAHHLYAHRLPFEHVGKRRIEFYKSQQLCGKETGIYEIGEATLDEALEIAKQNRIRTSPSGIFGLNYLLENKDRLPKYVKYVVVNTGCSDMDMMLTK